MSLILIALSYEHFDLYMRVGLHEASNAIKMCWRDKLSRMYRSIRQRYVSTQA